jgi:hypothetical protein
MRGIACLMSKFSFGMSVTTALNSLIACQFSLTASMML